MDRYMLEEKASAMGGLGSAFVGLCTFGLGETERTYVVRDHHGNRLGEVVAWDQEDAGRRIAEGRWYPD